MKSIFIYFWGLGVWGPGGLGVQRIEHDVQGNRNNCCSSQTMAGKVDNHDLMGNHVGLKVPQENPLEVLSQIENFLCSNAERDQESLMSGGTTDSRHI